MIAMCIVVVASVQIALVICVQLYQIDLFLEEAVEVVHII